VPGKLVAFSGPAVRPTDYVGFRAMVPEDYWDYWHKRGVQAIVRLNKKVRARVCCCYLCRKEGLITAMSSTAESALESCTATYACCICQLSCWQQCWRQRTSGLLHILL
jgi:hypothetical protein